MRLLFIFLFISGISYSQRTVVNYKDENGRIRSETIYLNDEDDDPHIDRDYYDNGQIAIESHYKNHNNWATKITCWYKNGKKLCEGSWKWVPEDTQRGVYTKGIHKIWYSNGQLAGVFDYGIGKVEEGLLSHECYDENGLTIKCSDVELILCASDNTKQISTIELPESNEDEESVIMDIYPEEDCP